MLLFLPARLPYVSIIPSIFSCLLLICLVFEPQKSTAGLESVDADVF